MYELVQKQNNTKERNEIVNRNNFDLPDSHVNLRETRQCVKGDLEKKVLLYFYR